MNKDYLKQGDLDESIVSQVFFRDNNKIDMDLHFGCGIWVFNNQAADLEQVMEFFTQLSTDTDDKRWVQHRSIFASMTATVEMGFHDSYIPPTNPFADMLMAAMPEEQKQKQHKEMKNYFPYIIGKVEKFDPVFKQVSLMKNGVQEGTGQRFLNNKLEKLKDTLDDPKIKFVVDTFNRGVPVVNFPGIERCLGLANKDAVMEIKDGYAIMGYDYDVTKSDQKCLFSMKENLKEKELREAKISLGK